CESRPDVATHVAVRLAAKEAVYKALQGSQAARGIGWRDIEVTRAPDGRPDVSLSGSATARARELGVQRVLLSLTHTHLAAIAVAEVDEARQFLGQARLDAVGLPAQVRAVADTELALLRAMVVRTAPPDSVAARANGLVGRIAAATGGALDPFPARPPSLARGAAVYRDQCLACHGQ